MRKFTLFFAALFVAFGLKAQTTNSHLKDGYFDFAQKITKMTEITSADQLVDGMKIAISHYHHEGGNYEHNPYWLSVDSKVEDGATYHKIAMHENSTGLSIFQLEKDGDKFKIKCDHVKCLDAESGGCYLPGLSGSSTTINTSRLSPGKFTFIATNGAFALSEGNGYTIWVDATTISRYSIQYVNFDNLSNDVKQHCLFKIYKVEEVEGLIGYVEGYDVELTGPSGNVFTGKHSGWSDMYNFALDNNVTITDVVCDWVNKKITAKVTFPFPVSGETKQNWVYVNPFKNQNIRWVAKDGSPKVLNQSNWGEENDASQWAIYPVLVSSSSSSSSLRYKLQNKATGTYLYTASTANTHNENTVTFVPEDQASLVNIYESSTKVFELKVKNGDTEKCLSTNSSSEAEQFLGTYGSHNGTKCKFQSVTIDAFQQSYNSNLQFWNDQVVTTLPEGLPACNATDKVYRASRPIYVTNADGTVKVKFTYNSGSHQIVTLGVDVVAANGKVLQKHYASKIAGSNHNIAEYTLSNLPLGKCFLRYFVCHRAGADHDLTRTSGTIDVTGGVLAAQPQEATYEYYYNGNKFAEQTVGHLYAGNKVVPFELPNRSYIKYSVAGTTITENMTSPIRVDCTPDMKAMPFKVGEDYESATWYMLKIRGSKYLASSASAPYTNNTSRPNIPEGAWAFVGNPIEGIKVLNRATGEDKTLGCDNYNDKTNLYMKAEGVAWCIKALGDGFILYANTDDAVHDHAGGLQIWHNSGGSSLTDAGSVITIAEELPMVEVAYNYTFNDAVKETITKKHLVGESYSAPDYSHPYVTWENPEGTITDETTSVEVTLKNDLPFEVSESFDNATWYAMTIRSNNKEYVKYSESAPYYNTKDVPTSTAYLWAFAGNAFDGIQVMNKAAGSGKTLGFDAKETASNIYMKEGETNWTIVEGTNGFVLKQDENAYLHDYHSDKLQFWVSDAGLADAGSALNVELIADYQLLANVVKKELDKFKADFDDSAWGSGWRDLPGVNNYHSTNADLPGLEEAYNIVKDFHDAISETTTEEEVQAKLDFLNEVRAALEINQPVEGYFYRLRHTGDPANYLSSVVSDNRLEMQSGNATNPNLMFAYIDGGLVAYSNGLSIDAYSTLAVGTMGTVSFEAANNGKWGQYNIKVGGRYIYGRGNTQNNHVDSGTGTPTNAGETGYNWWLEEVTALPVKLNYAADKGHCYATLWTPVALNLPAGVRAYVGTIEGTVLTLTEIEGSVIPANSGVLLWAEGVTATTTYNFEVNKTSTATLSNNAFVGAALTTLRNGAGYYSLGNKDGVTAFYNYTGANLQGFRARIAKDAASGVQTLTLRFGDATGIDEITSAFENAAVYDLSGRRVNAPQKGLYIVNGKKVYIK